MRKYQADGFFSTMNRAAIVALLAGSMAFAADISIPLGDGEVLIQDPQFITKPYDIKVPKLTFRYVNGTTEAWLKVVLQFDIDYSCHGEIHHLEQQAKFALGYSAFQAMSGEFSDYDISLSGKVNDCQDEKITAKLVSADSLKGIHIDGTTGEYTDLVEKFRREEAENNKKREEAAARAKAEAGVQAEAERRQAEAERKKAAMQAKKDAARRKLLEAEERAEQAKRDAEAAEKRRQLIAKCTTIYRNTANKKVGDLTVVEEQQVRACQLLGMYPPQD